jgi:hypothetical protein
MRSKNLIVLALVVIGLGGFILLVERHQPTTDERTERADRVFPGLDGDEISSIELTTGSGAVSLVQVDDGWRLTEPLDYPADATAVRSLVSAIEALDAERSLPLDEVELADFGLDEPPLGVTLGSLDGRRFSLTVGAEMPLGSKRAIRVGDDDEIVVTSSAFVSSLDKQVDQWRSRDVVDVLEHDLASVEISSGEDTIHAVRSGDRWQLTEPVADLADREQMRSLISELNALRVGDFLTADSDTAGLGLEPPEYRVVLLPSDGRAPLTVELGHPEEGDSSGTIACWRNGQDLFRVPDTIRTRLAKAPVLWRSSKVWNFSSWDVAAMELTNPTEEMFLDRADGLWQSADGEEVDGPEVSRRLNALADLEARDFDLLQPPTEVMGSVVLTLDENGPEELVYTFYAPLEVGGHAAVTVSTRDNVMGVDSAVAETIVGDLDALMPPPAERIAEDEAGPGID